MAHVRMPLTIHGEPLVIASNARPWRMADGNRERGRRSGGDGEERHHEPGAQPLKEIDRRPAATVQ